MPDLERQGSQPPRRIGGESAVVPEGADSLKRVMDQTQAVLEAVYGLTGLGLLRASGFIYPEVSSEMAERKLQEEGGNNRGFFISDAETDEGIRKQNRALEQRKQAFRESVGLPRNRYSDQDLDATPSTSGGSRSLIPRLGGRFNFPGFRKRRQEEIDPQQQRRDEFQALQPVIYISPDLIARTSGVQNFSELATPEGFRALDVISEETGHFLYAQAQYMLHTEVPGIIVAEGMALIDTYRILREAGERTGQNIFDATNPFVRELVAKFVRKISERGEIAERVFEAGGYDFTASRYTDSVRVMGGFVKHLVTQDAQGNDTTAELQSFYRMTGPQKGRYLRKLYQNYVDRGDATYRSPLLSVIDRTAHELEFEDEELWKEKWDKVKDTSIPYFIDPF